jgi:carboxylate-amine ligase
MRSYGDYNDVLQSLVRTNSIPDGSKIWWDVRPHHMYPTLEFRVCDVCTRVEEAVCCAAILQAVVAKLWKLRRDNMTYRIYPSTLIEENKWRTVRHGLDGKLVDFGKEQELPARELIREMLEWFIDDVVDELGSRREVEYAFKIMRDGTSADRQLATFDQTGDLKAVVDRLISETAEGVRPDVATAYAQKVSVTAAPVADLPQAPSSVTLPRPASQTSVESPLMEAR